VIPKEYQNVRFRQVAKYLRWFVGDGFAHMEESYFPSDAEGQFFEPDEPIYLTFPDDMHGLDITRQLRIGGLVIEDTNQKREARAVKASEARMTEGLTPQAVESLEGGGSNG
jgi:hypothetical protein